MSGLSDSPSSSEGLSQSSGRIVDYNGVSKIYGEGTEKVVALEDIDLEINEGEFVSFVGPSGCGKTTLLHLTSGLLLPTEGSVVVDGMDVSTDDHEKHKVGLVFQEPVLLEWRTVLKNVLLPVEIMKENGVLDRDMDFYRERAQELLEMVGIGGFADSYPNELSGGMQQRASICRSLIYDPPILLMDEPFGALDAFTRDRLNVELLNIWKETEKTVLFVTHNLEEAAFLSDRIVVLSSRPGEIRDVIDVPLDRPRDENTKTDDEYHEITSQLYTHFQGIESFGSDPE